MSKAGRMIGVQTPWYRFGLWLQGYGSVRVLWLGVGHGVLRFVGVLGPRNPKTKALTSKPPRKFAARTLLTPRSRANFRAWTAPLRFAGIRIYTFQAIRVQCVVFRVKSLACHVSDALGCKPQNPKPKAQKPLFGACWLNLGGIQKGRSAQCECRYLSMVRMLVWGVIPKDRFGMAVAHWLAGVRMPSRSTLSGRKPPSRTLKKPGPNP